jgi:N-dimethylarginine dimethylaminohydrolase
MTTISVSADPDATQTLTRIVVHQEREYDNLRHVVWSPIRSAKIAWRELFDVSLIRQVRHNRIGLFNWKRAAPQHETFRAVLEREGVVVHEPDFLPDVFSQYGPRDVGVVIDDLFVPTRPRRAFRQQELIGMRPLLERISRVGWLDSGTIEGGDVMLDDGVVMVGLSEETDDAGISALRYLLGREGIEREVVPMRFAHRGVIHLDCKLAVVGPSLAIAHVPSFSPETRRFLESRFELIAVTDAEQRDIQINVLPLGGGRTIVKSNATRIADELARRGLTPVPVEYDKVTASPGSFRCTTLPLVRN